MTFTDDLVRAAHRNDSWVCVGLDPRPDRFPPAYDDVETPAAVRRFLADVVERTADLVCAYKPNAAYFEALGPEGPQVLADVVDLVPDDIPVILDAKRGDIGATQEASATWAFDHLGADAVTVHPYLGWDGIAPMAQRADRGVFVLVRTSNPGARDLQDLPVVRSDDPGAKGETIPLYEAVCNALGHWHDDHPNLAAVAAATYPEELATVRRILGPDPLVLAPGVGAQGGDARAAARAGANAKGERLVVTSSRSILYADDPREACRDLQAHVEAGRNEAGE